MFGIHDRNYMKRSLTVGLRSIEIETDRGTPASIEGPEGIKCELELTLFFSTRKWDSWGHS